MQLPDDLPAPADPRLRALLDVDLAMIDVTDRLAERWNAHAAMHGVSGAQIKVLLSLRGDDAVPMSEVATRLDYDASNLTTLVERLRGRGFLERTEDPGDRRRKTLRLTPAGEAQGRILDLTDQQPQPDGRLERHRPEPPRRLLGCGQPQ